MARERTKPTGGQKPSSSADEATNGSHDVADNPAVVGNGGLQPDDPELLEVVELSKRRPIFWAIAARLSEVAGQAGKLPDGSEEKKKFERRFRKLEPYICTPLYCRSKSEQDRITLTFAQSIIQGVIGRRGQRFRTPEDVIDLIKDYAKRIRKRPIGNPVRYRHRIAEALEIKVLQPQRTWQEIFEQMEDDLRISFDDFNRQIQLLRRLLREEGIALPQPAEDEQA